MVVTVVVVVVCVHGKSADDGDKSSNYERHWLLDKRPDVGRRMIIMTGMLTISQTVADNEQRQRTDAMAAVALTPAGGWAPK